MIGIARILTRRDGLYEPDAAGDLAVITPVHDRHDELADLVAWWPDEPETWWLRRGDETPFLGTRNLAMAAYYGDPITLHPTPWDWLLAGRKGVCVLQWSWPLDNLFEGVGAIECSSPALRQRLVAALRRWEPRVTVRQGVRHAA